MACSVQNIWATLTLTLTIQPAPFYVNNIMRHYLLKHHVLSSPDSSLLAWSWMRTQIDQSEVIRSRDWYWPIRGLGILTRRWCKCNIHSENGRNQKKWSKKEQMELYSSLLWLFSALSVSSLWPIKASIQVTWPKWPTRRLVTLSHQTQWPSECNVQQAQVLFCPVFRQ